MAEPDPFLEAILTRRGREFLAEAATTGRRIRINSVRFGSAVGIVLNEDQTDVIDFVYEGGIVMLSYAAPSRDEVHIRISLSEDIGDFTIGNLALIADDYNGGSFVFAVTTTDIPVYKTKTVGTRKVGTRQDFIVTIRYLSILEQMDLSIMNLDYSTWPAVNDVDSLPPAINAPYEGYVVNNYFGSMALAMRRPNDTRWYMLTSSIIIDGGGSNGNGGVIWVRAVTDGGVVGDGYVPVIPYFGGRFSIPSTRIFDCGQFGQAITNTIDFGEWSPRQ